MRSLGGRVKGISGSRPTMIVSEWWRVWLQRQGRDSRSTMNEAISYRVLFIQSVLKAVPCPDSCQRESEDEAYTTAYRAKGRITHHVPHSR